MTVILGIFMFILVVTCVFMVLLILAQRAKTDGGMGAALGGGMAEAAFGGESASALQKITTWAAVVFFVLSFGLYLSFLAYARHAPDEDRDTLPASPSLIQDGSPRGMAPGEFDPDGFRFGDQGLAPGITFDLPEGADEPAAPEADSPTDGENP